MKLISISAFLALLLLVEGRNEEDGRIVVAYSTKTAFSITTSTTTVPLTCNLAVGVNVCKRKRYRRYNKVDVLQLDKERFGTELEATPLEDPETNREVRNVFLDDDSKNREGRIAVTVWTTRSSVYTVTSTSINSAITFSVSYFCTFAGATYAPSCG